MTNDIWYDEQAFLVFLRREKIVCFTDTSETYPTLNVIIILRAYVTHYAQSPKY